MIIFYTPDCFGADHQFSYQENEFRVLFDIVKKHDDNRMIYRQNKQKKSKKMVKNREVSGGVELTLQLEWSCL